MISEDGKGGREVRRRPDDNSEQSGPAMKLGRFQAQWGDYSSQRCIIYFMKSRKRGDGPGTRSSQRNQNANDSVEQVYSDYMC